MVVGMDESTGESRTVGRVVGDRLRQLRREVPRLQRQDDVAARVREAVGLEWTQSTIAGIEAGRRSVTVDELIALSIACDVKPWEWFVGDGVIEIAPGARMTFRAMRAMLGHAEDVDIETDFDLPMQRDESARLQEISDEAGRALAARAQDTLTRLWPGAAPLVHPLRAALDSQREAEQKAAARLRMDPLELSVLFHALFFGGLTENRDRRVEQRAPEGTSPRSLQAIRGHVTRELLDEFEGQLRDIGIKRPHDDQGGTGA